MAKSKKLIALLMAGPALAGCTSDPAFWEAFAEGLDQAAYEIANQPVCNWYTDRYGVVRQHCVPAYATDTPYYPYPGPRYRDRDGDRRHWRDQERRRHRGDGGHRDGRRDSRNGN